MFKSVLCMSLLISLGSGHAAEVLRDPRGLLGWYGKPAEKETMIRLVQAKIAHLNFALIRRDFDAAKDMSDIEIESAVLNCVGLISRPQLANELVNSAIPVRKDSRGKFETGMAYRPLGYGRAAVFPCLGGLIDVKGTGGRTAPAQDVYKTGLFSLARSLREELMQRVVALIFAREGYGPGTVENYGEVDLGFDLKTADGQLLPAGGILRQGHRRDNPVGTSPRGEKIEGILRKYGLTTSHQLKGSQWHMLRDHNAQTDANGALFDYETVHRYPKFSNSPVNPDPRLELPLEEWHEQDKVQPWANRLARAIRAGQMNGADVEHEFEKWLKPLIEKWNSCELAITP